MKTKGKKQKFKLLKFLSILYGNCDPSGFIELRPMTSDYEIDYDNRSWYSLEDKKEIVEHAWKLRNKRHLFFGVGTRTKQGKNRQKGSKSFIKELPAIFCDQDFEDFPLGGRAEAEDFIEDFFVSESIRVFSGHGYHVYFLLDEPYDVRKQGTERIERLLGVVQDLLFGDKVGEVSRVLRLPLSINLKNPSHPVLTKIEKIKNKRYSLKDFEDQFWHIIQQKQNTSFSEEILATSSFEEEKNGNIDIKSLKVSEKIKTLIRKGNSTKKYTYHSRSEGDMAVITGLLAADYGAQKIKKIFEQHPEGIGEKYHEKGSAKDKYLKHSINSAREFLSSESKHKEAQNEQI